MTVNTDQAQHVGHRLVIIRTVEVVWPVIDGVEGDEPDEVTCSDLDVFCTTCHDFPNAVGEYDGKLKKTKIVWMEY